MNKKRKVTKRIAAWALCFAMVLTTINLPTFAQVVAAEEIGDTGASDEEARQAECLPASENYLSKFLTYLSLKYPEIGIDTQYGTGANLDIVHDVDSDLHNWYNATKMARQTSYDTIEINGNDTFEGYPNLTKNMVQFKFLGNFGGKVGVDEYGKQIYSDAVKTLIIRNVDEIRNLYVPASVETLIIENTTFNCYSYPSDSPGFQSGMLPGDLEHCENLKKLVLKNVKFGDNYKNPDVKDKDCGWGTCDYETNYVLNLQNCPELSELDIDVSFADAPDVFLTIEGGVDNLFDALTDDKCNISPAPGTDAGQVTLLCNSDSYLAKRYNSEQSVKFKNGLFRLWLINLGYDTNHDRIISQAELDAIETLTINDETAHLAPQTSLTDFEELADISQMHNLKTLDIDFYDPNLNGVNAMYGYRYVLEGIDFPDSLENLSMKNVYWKKNTQTKSHDNADIILTNLKTLNLYNTDVSVNESDDSFFDHHTCIELTDTDGVLKSCVIEKTDVESITLTNSSEGRGILSGDEKRRIRFSAPDCPNLKSIEFLGEGYAIEGSLELTGDKELTHVGVPNADRSQWIVYGEYDMTYAPVNVILNSCINLGSDCSDIVIDYDFVNGRDLYVYAMNTYFSDDHALTIKRQPGIEGDVAGNVYLACDKDKWVYIKYSGKDGYIIENRDSFPTIAVFALGQNIRTSGEGEHNSDSIYTEDTDRWVERRDLVLYTGLGDIVSAGYKNGFGNLTFYVVDKIVDESGNLVESLRKVFYEGEGNDVYVEWEQQNNPDPIITLPTVKVGEEYKLAGSRISSTGTPGEVSLKLYVYKTIDGNKEKSYIGYQEVKVYQTPDSIEIVNDGTLRGSGTKDDPYIIDKNEELRLKARTLVNGKVDEKDYANRAIDWRVCKYDETPTIYTDSDGYSFLTGYFGGKEAGVTVIREKSEFETDAAYDLKLDEEHYSHRRYTFDSNVTKYKIRACYRVDSFSTKTAICGVVYVEYHPCSSDAKAIKIDGTKHGKECSLCHEIIVTGNHDFSNQPYYATDDKSQHHQKCKDCGATSIPVAHTETEIKNKKDATCTEKGYTGDTCCKACGAVIEAGKDIEASGHSWDEGKVTREPSKDAEGIKTFTCKICGETKTETIDKLPDNIDPSSDPDKPAPTPNPEPVKPLIPEISVKGKFDVAAAVATVSDKKPLAYAITSSDKKAGKITKAGILTAKKAGKVEITAYSDKKKTEEITKVKVVIKSTKVPTKDTIRYMDETYDLKSKITDMPLGVDVKFSISEKQQKFATVDAKTGIITLVKNGKVKVTVEIGEGKNAAKFYTTVTIKTPQINPAKAVVITKDKAKAISLKNVKADDKIEWSVSDTTKAEIIKGSKDTKIKVKGLEAGKVILTADVNGHKINKEIEITE